MVVVSGARRPRHGFDLDRCWVQHAGSRLGGGEVGETSATVGEREPVPARAFVDAGLLDTVQISSVLGGAPLTGGGGFAIYNHMVVGRLELSDDEVDRIFRALADATRRDIVRRTLEGEATVSALATAYDMSFAAVQKHVSVLEGAGLVTKRRNGRERIVRANPETIARAQDLLGRYELIWRSRIDRLDALLAEGDGPRDRPAAT